MNVSALVWLIESVQNLQDINWLFHKAWFFHLYLMHWRNLSCSYRSSTFETTLSFSFYTTKSAQVCAVGAETGADLFFFMLLFPGSNTPCKTGAISTNLFNLLRFLGFHFLHLFVQSPPLLACVIIIIQFLYSDL